jgi:hypothetical protein
MTQMKPRSMYRNNSTGHRGVSKIKSGEGFKYIARFRKKYPGCFDTALEASRAYEKLAAEDIAICDAISVSLNEEHDPHAIFCSIHADSFGD